MQCHRPKVMMWKIPFAAERLLEEGIGNEKADAGSALVDV